jgi:hypothetical protein
MSGRGQESPRWQAARQVQKMQCGYANACVHSSFQVLPFIAPYRIKSHGIQQPHMRRNAKEGIEVGC